MKTALRDQGGFFIVYIGDQEIKNPSEVRRVLMFLKLPEISWLIQNYNQRL